jgi:hypothetical protein
LKVIEEEEKAQTPSTITLLSNKKSIWLSISIIFPPLSLL